MPWTVYVVRCGDDSLYTGVTTDPERRLAEHPVHDVGLASLLEHDHRRDAADRVALGEVLRRRDLRLILVASLVAATSSCRARGRSRISRW